jgi:uncharacterized repeat protein (TIGR01451 family)
MKNSMKYFLLVALCMYWGLWQVHAQTSPNTVKYQVTYDAPTTTYTAWVVPDYSVPNTNNNASTEKGATAQFTIVVPKDFVITLVTDITGTWTKTTESSFIKLGPGNPNQNFPGLDPTLNYYVIGKTASETDYGLFAPGVPVALFSFKGNGCFGPIRPLAPGDPFIAAADDLYSLNVGNSFYSRSGQPAGGNVVPLEQFVNITGGNANCSTPPVVVKQIFALNDNGVTTKNTVASGNVLLNDNVLSGTAPLVVSTTPVLSPANGTLTLNANGTYTFTPTNGFVGTTLFKYRVCDSSSPALCDTATVSISVVDPTVTPPTNSAPIVLADNATTQPGVPVSGNVLTNDKDPDPGQTLTAALVNGPANGTLSLNPDGSYTYTPNTGYYGSDEFTYKACDNGSPQQCATTAVAINVLAPGAPNSAPVAGDDQATRPPTGPATGNVLTNDRDPEGGTLTVSTTPVSGPANGTVTIGTDGTFTYTPNPGFTGIDKFTYQVCDNGNPSKCSQGQVFVVPVINNNTGIADLMITKVLEGSKTRALGATISYRVVVHNSGPGIATNIVVKDSVGTGITLLNGTTTKGTFSNSLWTIPQIASGDSAVLTVSARVEAQGVSFNYAIIKQSDQPDNNQTNNKAVACVTVPILLCSGQSVEATVPANYANVIWYLNGQQVGTGNVFTITATGTYTYTASNATCPADGCCPLIVQADNNCCPPQICVPVTIVRKRSNQ